ncbi:hypothetical protein CR492_12325 [Methylocella silvestris]|uniref:Uncharacterized protein n=1 Tax=Methylocella silvestris TaxID=199596 RepID=A0A2J7TG10_METSI|nr:hypothetical protein CR492_12325 [Methylocella silvestris]
MKFDWNRLEQALGRTLSSDQRAAVNAIATEYMLLEGAERTAPFKKDRDRWIDNLREIANTLESNLIQAPCHDRAARDGLAEVQIAFDKISLAAYGTTLPLEDVASFLKSAVAACDRNFDDRPAGFGDDAPVLKGIQEGRQWKELVRQLHGRFAAWQLPSNIRNDADTSGKNSPFVEFFSALQRDFPEDSRRHTQSVPALAKAMARALGT